MTTTIEPTVRPTVQPTTRPATPAAAPGPDRIDLPSPPALRPRESGGGAMMNAIPMIGGVGGMIVVATMGGAGPVRFLVAGLFLFTMVAFVLVQLDRQRGQRRGQIDAQRADYLRHLARARARARAAAGEQRRAAHWHHPAPTALPALAAESSRVGERDPAHPAFLQVRYGVTERPLALELVPPEDVAGNAADPVCEAAVHRLIAVHGSVPDLPATLDLRTVAGLELAGPGGREIARALVCQLAAFHPPDRLVLAAVVAPDALVAWDWLKWLPHARRPEVATGTARSVATAVTRLTAGLPAESHLVLITDGVTAPALTRLRDGGTTVLELGRPPTRGPIATGRAILTDSGEVATLRHGRSDPIRVRADRLSVPEAEAVGRRLLGQADAVAVTATPRRGTSTGTDLLALLRLGDVHRLDPQSCWRRTGRADRLRVPIGVDDDGRPVHLDLDESARGGMGPHGLVVGATGSGKSEFLRTLVLGLALTHPPDDLNLVLVDFKGGASFAGLAGLPHAAAVITNLADDLSLVDRMQDALSGELIRRQELLRAAGNHASVHEYEAARRTDPSLPALPALVIVVDEFSELLAARPEFIDLFLAIGRLGRSLGLHLLLASQRLEEGRLRGLDSHLSYRIGLRTFSAAESRAVLGVPDAFELPAVPGTGYLQAGPAPLRRFRAAYVSGPPPNPSPHGPARSVIRPFTLADLPRAPDVSAPEPRPVGPERQGPGDDGPPPTSLLELAVDRLAGHGTPAHRIWLPPLEVPTSLDQLLTDLTVDPSHGLASPSWRRHGGLVVPLGVVDRPRAQRRDALLLDLRGAGGHVAIVGGPRSGKSTLARTLLAGLALVGTPQQTQFYVLDFGGGSFAPFAGHPHVAAVATRSTPELVHRVLTEVEDLLERREAYFAEHGIDTIETYRALRAQGQADDGWGEVVLVIDGWSALRTEIEDVEARLQALASRALAYGVHLVLTASRWADFRLALRDAFGSRFELRLGSPIESEIDRTLAAGVPPDRPGRGLTPTREHFLAALPRLDGSPDPHTLAAAIDDLVARTRAGWTGPPGPKLQVLPDRVELADLAGRASGRGLALGLAERDQRTVSLDPDHDPHLLVFGDHQSGKTSLLRGIARELVRTRTPREAQLVLLDYRRSLLGEVPEDYLLHDLTSADAAEPALRELADYLRTRLPGPRLRPEVLRDRSWWSGAEVFVLVDDHDLVSTSRGSPLTPLLPLLPRARDVGLHLLLARRSGGAGRALYEPTIQTLRELGQPGLLLAGSPEEGHLLGGLRPAPAPPGRARLVTREQSPQVVQLAWSEPSQRRSR